MATVVGIAQAQVLNAITGREDCHPDSDAKTVATLGDCICSRNFGQSRSTVEKLRRRPWTSTTTRGSLRSLGCVIHHQVGGPCPPIRESIVVWDATHGCHFFWIRDISFNWYIEMIQPHWKNARPLHSVMHTANKFNRSKNKHRFTAKKISPA